MQFNEDPKQKKIKAYYSISYLFLLLLVISIFLSVSWLSDGKPGEARGDLFVFFFPVYIILGAIAVVFRAKAKELAIDGPKLEQAEKKPWYKHPALILCVAIPVAILTICILMLAISGLQQVLSH